MSFYIPYVDHDLNKTTLDFNVYDLIGRPIEEAREIAKQNGYSILVKPSGRDNLEINWLSSDWVENTIFLSITNDKVATIIRF